MATDKQIAANRENARKSRGPGDTSITRFNAYWHGCRGSLIVLPDEDPEEFEAMANTLYAYFEPIGTYEYNLVKRMADRSWEIERISILKAEAISNAQYRNVMEQELATLEYYETKAERSLFRNRRELTQMQALRGKDFEAEFAEKHKEHHAEQMRLEKKRRRGGLKRRPLDPSQVKVTSKPPTPRAILLETERYQGPRIPYIYSEGEIAIDHLTDQAVREIRRQQIPDGRTALKDAIERQADLELANEDSGLPDPDDGS